MDSEAIHRPWHDARFETITGRKFTVLSDSDLTAFIDQRAARKPNHKRNIFSLGIPIAHRVTSAAMRISLMRRRDRTTGRRL
jgi:hypothetical protein